MAKKVIKKEEIMEPLQSWFINCYHHCGCKFRTDGMHIWCSGEMCNYIITKKKFDQMYSYNHRTGLFNRKYA